MSDRGSTATAALVAAVVLAGTVVGGLVAAATFGDGGADAPADARVVAAIRNRAGLDEGAAGCVLGRLVAAGALTDELRRRLVDASDGLDDVPAVPAAVAACTAPPTTVEPGPLGPCTAGAGADAAAREVCATQALVALLQDGAELDTPTASCAAAAVVDALGVDAVVEALETGVGAPDLRERVRAAFSACGPGQ